MKLIRTGLIVLLLFTGINALLAGALLMRDASGSLIGLHLDYLQHSPFPSYFIPGLVLFVVNGVLNVRAALRLIRKKEDALWSCIIQGILLGGWIVVQVIFVRDFNPLHAAMLTIALLLISGALKLKKQWH